MKLPCLDSFTLVGGTALSLQYGHRKSVDLDFFGDVTELNTGRIKSELETIGDTRLASQSSVMLGYYVDDIKVDIVKYKYKLIELPIIIDSIRMAHPLDIGAMKLAAISGRGKRKDFYDLYFLLRKYTLVQLLECNRLKFPDSNEMIILKSIGYFDDAESDTETILSSTVSWKTIKSSITKHLRDYLNS